MDMHVVDLLMRSAAIVLENIVVLRSRGAGDLGGDRQEVGETVVGDVC
jgi:hypothetical protein